MGWTLFQEFHGRLMDVGGWLRSEGLARSRFALLFTNHDKGSFADLAGMCA